MTLVRSIRVAVWFALGLAVASAGQLSWAAGPPSRADVKAHENRLLGDGSGGDDWAAYGRTYGEQHFSPLADINSGNVGKLGLAWSVDLPPGNTITQPLAIDGVIFFTVGNSVIHAVDAVHGRTLWTYDPHANEQAGMRLRSSWGSRGLAYWNGKILTGTVDGRLIAVDMKTGHELWSQQTLEPGDMRYITGAPRVFNGRVIIGHGGADTADIRGYVTAYDADSGKFLWRFYTVPGDPAKGFEDATQAMAAKSWSGKWWTHGGGGNVWNAMTYDAKFDTILIGTGNGAPWNWHVRSGGVGDNLFVCSIVALDAATGKYKWHYQVNPSESWDYNASMDMHLATLKIGGKLRDVIVTAPKNGFLYVIDRSNGNLISAGKIARHVTWASSIDIASGRPVENPDAHYPDGKTFELWPSPMGAHTNLPSAFSPSTGLVYVPVGEQGITINDVGIDPKTWTRHPFGEAEFAANAGYGAKPYILPGTSRLSAWNPVTQKEVWNVPTPLFWNGGLMVTAGDLVFQGQAAGKFVAYDASTGAVRWSVATGGAVLAPPITFRAAGRQYISVLTGMGLTAGIGAAGLPARFDYYTQTRRLLTFALDADAPMPSSKPYALKPANDAGYKPDLASEARGAALFGRCLSCHGPGADAGGGIAPDLRASLVTQSPDAFGAVVRQGALVSKGMPVFGELTDAELADLRQYIRSRAADLRTAAQH